MMDGVLPTAIYIILGGSVISCIDSGAYWNEKTIFFFLLLEEKYGTFNLMQ